MPMKRFCIISCFFVFCSFLSFGQKDEIISGGFSVSATVSQNGSVYVWGDNTVTIDKVVYHGVLGTGESTDYKSTPQIVYFHSNTTIQQVSCGSSHFVALDCYGKVWCWGLNRYGQCGQDTTTYKIVTSPMRVPAGVLAETEYDDGGYLTNVAVVCAGYENNFAILGDGQYQGMVVAWGGNGKSYRASSLGDGTSTDQITPVWCIKLDETKVSGIIQACAWNEVAMLLDEDGYVWTAGGISQGNLMLGRAKTGGYVETGGSGSGGSEYFGMVYVAENEPLSDIVQIACGTSNCQALDADGFVWGWGNHAWNSACGVGEIRQGSSKPKKVVAGSLNEEDTKGGFLLAKSIAAGISCGYAVSLTGKPVMWGQFGNSGNYGSSDQPRYVEYASGKVHDEVVFVNRGNTWGFYGLADGSIYAWGVNDVGQLGIGNTTNQLSVARRIDPPSGCLFRDPYPIASISPKNVEFCSQSALIDEPVTLDCGFNISSASLRNSYTITWYKDGEQVSTGNASNVTYTATEIGTYEVKIEYVGTGSGFCNSYEPAESRTNIYAYEQYFTFDDLHYCDDEAKVKVTPFRSASEYTWYANQACTTELGKSVGDEEITIDVSSISANGSGEKTVYVQETSMGNGLFLPENITNWKSSSDLHSQGTLGGSRGYATGFYVKEPVTLTSLSFYAAPSNNLGEVKTSLIFTVYEAISNERGILPNTSAQAYGTFVCTDTVTSTSSNNIQKYIATGSVSLNEGLYFIVPTEIKSSDFIMYTMYRGTSSLSPTNVDDLTGNILQFQSVVYSENPTNSSGYIFDITFTVGQKYCGVVPVTLPQECPPSIVYDDCDDGDEITNTGGYWFTFNDKSNQLLACEPGTLSSITPYVDNDEEFAITPAIMSESGYDGTGYAVHATYTLGTNYTPYSGNSCAPWVNPAYCGVGTQVGEDAASTVDWSAGTGISFWYKGSSSLFTVAISEVEDTDFHRYTVPECTEWTKITVLWSDLEQQSWGTFVTFSAKHIQKLMWEINTSYSGSEGSTGEIWIDDLRVMGIEPVELTALTIQPVHDSDLALQNLSPNINPLAIPIASGAAGDTLYLETILTPTEATYPIVVWSSSNEEVATVDSKGRVIGVSEGTATITARSKMNSEIFATFSVEVKIPCTTPDAPAVVDATYCYGDMPQELSVMASPEGSLMWYEAATGSTVHVESSQDVMGGARSMHGSFYTFDNGVQTKAQLGDKAANVVFCFLTLDENKETLDVFRFISGTEAVNEIVQSQASETKFVMISDATQEEFENVDWSEGTTSIDIAKTLEAGQKSVAFKNALSEGFFEVVSYDEDAEDLTINVWKIEHAAPYNESTASTTAPMPNTEEVGKTTYYVSQIVNGCESEKTPIAITVNELPSVSISADKDEVCAGETITLTADADDSGTFTWSGDGVTENGNTATVTAMTTTPESITVTLNYVSEYNCETHASATVTFLPVPTAPTAEDVAYCQNENAGMLTATASEGATLLWYESENSVVASTKAPVPSTATVGDTAFYVSQILNGCESARTEIIATVNSVQTVGIAVDKDEVCVGETVYLMAMPLNGLSYVWSGNGAEIDEHSSGITITPTETMLINLKFTGENGCESEASTTIMVNAIPEKPVAQSVSYCQNAEAQILTAIADGKLKWYIGDEASATAPVPSTAAIGETTYYVSQIVNGCESEKTAVVVTINELPSVGITADKDEVCLGETVTLTANAEDGDFAWSGGVTSTEKTVSFAPTETTSVSLTITNEFGCESEASTMITVKAIPEKPVAQPVTYCKNAVAQILTATADGEQKWYIGGEASATAPIPNTTIVGDTTYYVSQIVNGCESEKTAITVTINELPTVSITANKTEICAGETVTLTANAEDGDFAWSGGVTSTEKTMSFAPTETTSVSLTITNEFGCESEASTTITVKAIPEKPIAQSVSYCQNAVAQILTAIADGEQKWYIGDEASTTAPVPNTATVGDTTYYVSQIVNGCESEKTAIKVTVSELPSVGITANKTEICSGETVTLNANAEDGDFAWSGGVTSTEKTVSFAPTETTSVSVTFTNESGCESEASTTITVNAIPEKPVAQSVSYCQNAEAQILTAIADGKLKWYIGDEANATAPVPSTAAVGETTYYVSQIVNGCESEKTAVTVTISAVNIIATEIPEIEISDEEETLPTVDLSTYYTTETSSDITFTVTSSDPSIVDPVIRGDELEFVQYGDGTVTITVTATSGETVTSQSFTITVKPKPDQPTKPCELTVEPTITNVTCFGGEDGKIEVAVSGGAEPYTYKWNTGRTSKGIYAMAAGEYSILVRDSLGCTTTSTFTIEEPAEMSVSEDITNPSCGISNGSIAITIEGGTAPYTQRWYSGNGTIMESLENLQGDVYEVVIIDKNSCKLRKTYSLQESGAPSVSLKSVNASKCNEATGSCEIAVSSESEYTIVWSDATEATTEKSRSGMLPGTYTVTVNDAENCRSILSVTIPTETFRQPEIALVTVGEESGKNLVVWQKPETDMIAFYTVYREGDESGVYDKLGDVDFHETSIFVDPDANIMEQSWRYKISATDVCGNESPLSKEHKTIHLQKARGLDGEINLIWDSYEGIAYASYCLYRQTKSGSGLEMFKKVPASLNRYTDMNPPADVKGYYVAVVLPTEINENEPLKAESGPFALAISNIAEVENDGDIDAVDAVENDAVVYANGKNIVVLNANGKNVTINDITGRTIAQEKAVQSTVIPVQQVGVYLVTVGDKVQKVVVE